MMMNDENRYAIESCCMIGDSSNDDCCDNEGHCDDDCDGDGYGNVGCDGEDGGENDDGVCHCF